MPIPSAPILRRLLVAAPLSLAAIAPAASWAAAPARDLLPSRAMAPVRYAVFFQAASAARGAVPWWGAGRRTRWRT